MQRSAFLALFLVLGHFVAAGTLLADTISGTITLPGGDSAPAGGVEVRIDFSDSNSTASETTTVIIAQGTSSIDYSDTVPTDGSASWIVTYSYSGTSYVPYGYYSGAGTQWNRNLASSLPGGQDHLDIDMELMSGAVISGTLMLPGTDVAPAGGVDISLVPDPLDTSGDWQLSKTFTIAEGDSTVAYTLRIPADTGVDWSIEYQHDAGLYWSKGYYSTLGTQLSPSAATPLAGGVDHSVVNIVPFEQVNLSGTVSLPGADTAPAGGLSVRVKVFHIDEDTNVGLNAADVVIPATSSSVEYSLEVPLALFINMRVNYFVAVNDSYISSGYYHISGTSWDPYAVTYLDKDADLGDINLQLLQGVRIDGTVTLQAPAPAGGKLIPVTALASNQYSGRNFFTTITVAEATTVEPYDLLVPVDPGIEWKVHYAVDRIFGYYSNSGTKLDSSQATILAGGSAHTGIDLTLLATVSTNVISGTISLPSGDTAPAGGLEVGWSIYDGNYPATIGDWGWVTIAAGGSSTTFPATEVTPDPSAQWHVEYTLDTDHPDYLTDGYYSDSGTRPFLSQITPLSGGNDHVNVELELLPKIEGDIDLDSDLDLRDIIIGLQILTGETLDEVGADNDVNGDGAVSMEEVIYGLEALSL